MEPILKLVQFETVEVESPFERSSHITLKHVGIPIPNVDGDEIIDHTDDIPVETRTTMVTLISHSPAINNNTFSIQLENVSD
jgi:hypothetical protein